MRCPICLATSLFRSHRRGVLERGPLTWVGLLPFRCRLCQTRFYKVALRDPRRRQRGSDADLDVDRSRAPRWVTNAEVMVTVHTPGEASVTLKGTIDNASLDGARLRLPVALPEGIQLSVALEGLPACSATVRWSQPPGESGIVHGIRFEVPPERRAPAARPLRRLRLRNLLRRSLIVLIALGAIAVAAFGIVWLTESLQRYDPKFYEPKDLERQRYELQRLPDDQKPPRQP